MCRIAPGEYCEGKKDAPVPDIRIPETKTLYDSTVKPPVTDSPDMFVTYHGENRSAPAGVHPFACSQQCLSPYLRRARESNPP